MNGKVGTVGAVLGSATEVLARWGEPWAAWRERLPPDSPWRGELDALAGRRAALLDELKGLRAPGAGWEALPARRGPGGTLSGVLAAAAAEIAGKGWMAAAGGLQAFAEKLGRFEDDGLRTMAELCLQYPELEE
jgi:hypothetical protein